MWALCLRYWALCTSASNSASAAEHPPFDPVCPAEQQRLYRLCRLTPQVAVAAGKDARMAVSGTVEEGTGDSEPPQPVKAKTLEVGKGAWVPCGV